MHCASNCDICSEFCLLLIITAIYYYYKQFTIIIDIIDINILIVVIIIQIDKKDMMVFLDITMLYLVKQAVKSQSLLAQIYTILFYKIDCKYQLIN